MRVSIVGLGWLGEPLGEFLQGMGYDVVGSTTSSEKADRLRKKGINAYPFFLNPTPEGEVTIFNADLIIINIPPKLRSSPEDFHLKQIKNLKTLIENAKIPKVIFTSATSVYPDLNQEAYESDALNSTNTGNAVLLEVEKILWKDKSYDLTVIRLGGLLGDDRIPGMYFAGKENVVGHVPVNYIHRKDAVMLVHWIIDNGLWNETYNAVSPFHPLRKEIYEKNAEALGFSPPLSYEFPAKTPWKKIASKKILGTGFTFIFHPLHFSYIFPSKSAH